MSPTTITELAMRTATTLRQALVSAILRHLRTEYDIDTSQAEFKFDSEPQFNDVDHSFTHDVTVTIGNKLYDVEAYLTKDGKIEVDCWRTNGKLNMVLELHK